MTNDLCPKCGAYWECEHWGEMQEIQDLPRPSWVPQNFAAPINWERVDGYATEISFNRPAGVYPDEIIMDVSYLEYMEPA